MYLPIVSIPHAELTDSSVFLTFLMIVLGVVFVVSISMFLSFPFAMILRVKDSRVWILSWLYCETELITDGSIEVSGFREFTSYPVEYEDLPAGSPRDLMVLIGYFKPELHRIEIRDCNFFFLRTRSFCLLYDACLPGDREEAFRLARWWERFSMVYEALFEDEIPDEKNIMKYLDGLYQFKAAHYYVPLPRWPYDEDRDARD